MEAYGGRIDSPFQLGLTNSKAAKHVDEFHVFKFPDHKALERYRSNNRLLALAVIIAAAAAAHFGPRLTQSQTLILDSSKSPPQRPWRNVT